MMTTPKLMLRCAGLVAEDDAKVSQQPVHLGRIPRMDSFKREDVGSFFLTSLRCRTRGNLLGSAEKATASSCIGMSSCFRTSFSCALSCFADGNPSRPIAYC